MIRTFFRLSIFAIPALLGAQQWEVGVGAGYGLSRDLSVTAGSATGSAGFKPGVAATALFANQINGWMGGEARYTLQEDKACVKSGSTEATMSGQSHAIHYDVLIHAASKESPVRPFVAAGAGVKFYRGSGPEPVFQPLNSLVVLTHTQEAQPLISLGGGLKFSLSRKAVFRIDVRDYMTPLPSSVLAAPPNSKLTGWIHNVVFLAGVSRVF